ncbi:gamma-glutamyltransferase family protein [Cochlodiniinecator piscidefendens]|uniref:gamma-glutamyltransferase family protein n=1 Tax=Cochlodiniinecator piscidefendens TaxID=2715756 RepID=UPI0014092BF2|nr:gamma-glutamyltransferase family protein [Cochlodiniinecator piscidefendens]
MRDFQLPGRSSVYASNGMCATSHPLAAKVAIQILEAGGNAMDAAIAAGALLGICEPQMTGIGGDCFVLASIPGEDRIVAMNGSGRAPAALNADKLRHQRLDVLPTHSVEAITIPGAVDAFCQLSKDWGKIGLKASLAPAIYYAQAGVPVAPRTAFDWVAATATLKGSARNNFLINNNAPEAGQVFRAPKQAEVLRRIAMEGRDGFYEGEVAEDMVKSLNALGGCHTLDDFAAIQCNYTSPISGTYKDIELVEHPPNGQGATAILLGNILKEFDIASLDPLGSQRIHIEAEATKLAYDTRNRFIADPEVSDSTSRMLDVSLARDLAKLIHPNRIIQSVSSISEQVHKDTVYLTVVDKDRMAVSLIYSIFHSFGSGIASDKFGILFQNRGAGFNLIVGHPNEAAGGKRPLHTIIPGILKQADKVVMPFGVMGGQYQSTGHMRFISNMVDFGMDPQSAIDAPRSFAEGNELRVERGYSNKVRAELSELGHNVVIPPGPIGGAQAIKINHETGVLEGASDPRKDGCALGY